jgi:hypothetical protein
MMSDLDPQKYMGYFKGTFKYFESAFKRRAQYPNPVLISSSLLAADKLISNKGESSKFYFSFGFITNALLIFIFFYHDLMKLEYP